MMMAGLDGIQNKIHPGDPADKDLYDLEPEEAKHIPQVCHSLDMALEHLDKDREFLKRGGVFTNDVIDAYIGLKMQEVTRFRMSTHPCAASPEQQEFKISPIERGTHTVAATIRDGDGKNLCQSSAISFHVRQPSVLAPLNPNNPNRKH
jgi:glutamine synthetase